MKTYIFFLATFVIFLVVGSILFNLAYPAKLIPYLTDENSPIKGIACSYPVFVSTDTMEPRLDQGSLKLFNKCIDDIRDNLMLSDVVVYKREGVRKIASVKARTFVGISAVEYEVASQSGGERPDRLSPTQIIAVFRE